MRRSRRPGLRIRTGVGFVWLLAFGLPAGCAEATPPATTGPADGGPLPISGGVRESSLEDRATLPIITVTERDAIVSIDRPVFLARDEAGDAYAPDEPVIGLDVDGDARAYAIPYLSRHEVVNDRVGDLPVVVTWCPLCLGSVVYKRPTVDGVELDFGVSGKLAHNNLLLYDRQSDSLWSQLLGEAIWGPLQGYPLEWVPSLQTTWSFWRALHPESRALATPSNTSDPYADYYAGPRAGVHGEARSDDRLPPKAIVVGAVIDGEPVAYPLDRLKRESVVNDTVGGRPVLVVTDPETGTVAIYGLDPEDGGGTFVEASGRGPGLVVMDTRTGTRYGAWTGRPLGMADATPLPRLPATHVFWFAWKDLHATTRVFDTTD